VINNAELKVYKGVPHGLCTRRKVQVNADLLAFRKGEAMRRAEAA
jgi:non-heme chloroperoxidase